MTDKIKEQKKIKEDEEIYARYDQVRLMKIIIWTLALVIIMLVMNVVMFGGMAWGAYRIDQNNLFNQNLQALQVCREYGFIKTGEIYKPQYTVG